MDVKSVRAERSARVPRLRSASRSYARDGRNSGAKSRHRGSRSAIGPLALVLLAACSRPPAPPAGIGRRVATGVAGALRPSPDGATLAFLDRCARPPVPDLPPSVSSCDLEVVPAAGGAQRRVAEGVTTLPGGLAWSGSGALLAALADHDYATGGGTLVLATAAGEARRLAPGVTFYGFAPGRDTLVFVARGRLMLLEQGAAEPRAVPGGEGVATFELAPAALVAAGRPAGFLLAARRNGAAGGDLLVLSDWKGAAARVAAGTGDYGFAPDGRLAFTARGREGYDLMLLSGARQRARALGQDVQGFAFSRDGSGLAFLSGGGPGTPGDLLAAQGDGRAARMGTRVGEYRWSPQGTLLAWLQEFDPRIRAGTLAVGGPGQRTRELGRNVTAWAFSPDGGRIAFLEHATAGGYSVDLKLADLGAEGKPEVVARGVFGFDFSPEGHHLYYRAGCMRNAEACDLQVLPAAGLPPGKVAETIAGGVKSFEFDRWTPGRLLVTWARRDMVALDLAVWDGRRLVSVDTAALPGSAQLLPPDGRRVTYAVIDPKRAGVYVAEVGK